MRRRLLRILCYLILLPPAVAAVAGWYAAPTFLHPIRRELTPDLIREADTSFAASGGHREDFNVHAADGVMLRGWIVRAAKPNGNWVLLFHGVADNRVGVIGQSEFLLRAGYSIVMMDSRAHGTSDGAMATYGWLERSDTRVIIAAFLSEEQSREASVQRSTVFPPGSPFDTTPMPRHIFALGESMGAGIALQSAAVEPRIEGVVAEASFANLREASYDYAALRRSPFVGRTILRPFSWTLLYHGEQLTGLPVAEVSPEKAVAMRAFPVLLICDQNDDELPCRHTQQIYAAAIGPKQFWEVPGAFHTAGLGMQPVEFERRVLAFFANIAAGKRVQ